MERLVYLDRTVLRVPLDSREHVDSKVQRDMSDSLDLPVNVDTLDILDFGDSRVFRGSQGRKAKLDTLDRRDTLVSEVIQVSQGIRELQGQPGGPDSMEQWDTLVHKDTKDSKESRADRVTMASQVRAVLLDPSESLALLAAEDVLEWWAFLETSVIQARLVLRVIRVLLGGPDSMDRLARVVSQVNPVRPALRDLMVHPVTKDIPERPDIRETRAQRELSETPDLREQRAILD